MVWLRVCNASIGVHRDGDGPPAVILRDRADLAEIALDHVRRESPAAVARRAGRLFGQLDDLDGARAVRQAADEAAFLQRRDETVNAGLRAEIERVLHLVEGGRNAGLFQPSVDEPQEFVLLARQHLGFVLESR
jgi:hypothetical protein